MIDYYAEAVIASPWIGSAVASRPTPQSRSAYAYDIAASLVDARYGFVNVKDGNVDDDGLWMVDRMANAVLRAPRRVGGTLGTNRQLAAAVIDQAVDMLSSRDIGVGEAEGDGTSGNIQVRVKRVMASNDAVKVETGIGYPDVAANRRYTTFGVDDSWESIRHRNGDILQTTGTGQTGAMPNNLTVLRSLSYTDIDPVPVP